MLKNEILLIQSLSDVRSLKEEHRAGLYKNNPDAFNKAWARIAAKVEKLEEVETLEEKAERIKQESDYDDEKYDYHPRSEEEENLTKEQRENLI